MRSWQAHPLAGFALVLCAAALFGTLGPLSRFANEAGLGPLPLVAWRALIGMLAGVAFVAWRIRSGHARLVRPADLSTSARVLIAVAAFCGFALNLAMFIAFDLVTVAIALLGFYTYPAMVAVASVLLGQERLDRTRLAALVIALGGMAAVVAGQLDPSAGVRFEWLGLGLALGAAVCQAVFVTISRDGYRAVPTAQAMTFVLAVTFVSATVLAFATGDAAGMRLPLTDPDVIPLILFMGLFGAAIPSLTFLAGIRLIGGLRAGILMLIEPVVGVVLAAILLEEGIAPIQVGGGLAILVAAALVQRAAAREITVEPAATPAIEDRPTVPVSGAP